MIEVKSKREAGIAKLKRENYREFKRVMELQGCFEEANRLDDYYYMKHYDREINKAFDRAGVSE
jgi:hypothetical protein